MNKPTIVGLGLATLDILTRTPHLPNSNECFPVERIEMQGGGPVATALVAASRLGGRCYYLGSFAPDDTGQQITSELLHYGVDTSAAIKRSTGVSSVSVILVEQNSGHRAILFQKGTAHDLQEEEVSIPQLTSANALHLDGFYIPAALQAARIAKKHGVLVSFDGGAGVELAEVEALLPMVDMMVVALQFASQVTHLESPLASGPALLQKYSPRQVVITDGEKGCWYWDGQNNFHQPAFEVEVVDTTGAGDTFHGAYLYACLQQDWSPHFQLKFASAVAALKCTRLGGRKGIPDLRQTLEFLAARGETPK